MHTEAMALRLQLDKQELEQYRKEYDQLKKLEASINKNLASVAKNIEKAQKRIEASMYFGIEEFLNPEYASTYKMYKMTGTLFGVGPFSLSGVLPITGQRCVNLSIRGSWPYFTLTQVAGLLDAMMEHIKPIVDPKEELYHGKKYVSITTDDLSESGCVYALQSTSDLGTTWDLMIDEYRRPRVIAQKMSTIQLLMYMRDNGYTYRLTEFKHGFGFGGYVD